MYSVNKKRIKEIRSGPIKGPLLYWMSRDQRVDDNWAMLFTQELAIKHDVPFAVVFCLRTQFSFATERLIDFLYKGLEEVETNLQKRNIPFYFLLGDPQEVIPKFINMHSIGGLITDFLPLHHSRKWNKGIADAIHIPFYEVDAHNIVPVWEASNKQEYGAYTIRPKIQHLLPEFFEEYPSLITQVKKWTIPHEKNNWHTSLSQIVINKKVKPVTTIISGEEAAKKQLTQFIHNGLENYAVERNDPTLTAQSHLSPYLHFGHISSQRIAYQIKKSDVSKANIDAFLEEIIIRKELSDNYCYYNNNYDNVNGFPSWAIQSHHNHELDRREYLYSLSELETASTHDDLWNAAQNQMVKNGIMHGYMRMYWAKKILEWSPNVTIAQKNAISLNNTYFLDGRDPNGYTGIAWSIGGVHDRAWFERKIFGKIRYMNYNGAKNKFNILTYIKMNQ